MFIRVFFENVILRHCEVRSNPLLIIQITSFLTMKEKVILLRNNSLAKKLLKNFTLIIIVFLFAITSTRTVAQRLSNPLGFQLQLSGGFGDLRADHYHAGIDIRTQSSEGHPLLAVLDGYVSRVTVSPGGYGLAVYVTHPADSLITVYGHLQRFTPVMADIVKENQYEKESFSVDISFQPDLIPVNQGDIIGFSGNSGNSGGPHLHFEVRDLLTNELIDPLPFYQSQIQDTQKPIIRGLLIYPMEGKGMVNGSDKKQNIEFGFDKNGNPVITKTIEAWGEIGLGIRAIDRMNGTNFSYGVRDILLAVDGIELFRSYIDRFSQDESGYINSHTDYEEWSKNRSFYIKTFTDAGNKARFVASRNSGKITILEERIYNAVITLTDLYGNSCQANIKITGKKQDITPPDTAGSKLLRWYDYNSFSAKGIRMTLHRNSLYNSLYMRYQVFPISPTSPASPISPTSLIHLLHPSPVPLHYPAQLSLFIDSVLPSFKPNQYGIIRINLSDGRRTWIGGVYRDGWIDAKVSELDAYTVACDLNPPKITPIDPLRWCDKKKISIRISDDLSGIASYRGEINGKYALFEYDSKNALLTYTFDDERLLPGAHHLKLTVTDRCGNQSEYNFDFTR